MRLVLHHFPIHPRIDQIVAHITPRERATLWPVLPREHPERSRYNADLRSRSGRFQLALEIAKYGEDQRNGREDHRRDDR